MGGLKHSWRAMLFGRTPDRGQMGEKMVRGNEGRVCNARRGVRALGFVRSLALDSEYAHCTPWRVRAHTFELKMLLPFLYLNMT